MSKPDQKEIKEQLKKQNEEVYGDEQEQGENSEELLEDFTGRSPKPGENIAEIVNQVEKSPQD